MLRSPAVTWLAVIGAVLLSGCASPREKTAPCRHPLARSFAAEGGPGDCVIEGAVNPDRQAVLRAIEAATALPLR